MNHVNGLRGKTKNETKWLRIVHCRDIPLREGRAVRVNGREIAIFNLGDRFVAMDNRCPHRGGPLADGIVSGTTVVCPLHAWKFGVETGKGLSAPSLASCVETFRTRIAHGVVLLELPLEFGSQEQLAPICAEHEERQQLNWTSSVRVIG